MLDPDFVKEIKKVMCEDDEFIEILIKMEYLKRL